MRLGDFTVSSAMTLRKCGAKKSARGEDASALRNMLFGVKTTSGLRHLRNACRRRRWKYCAAVEGWQIWMFSLAASCR